MNVLEATFQQGINCRTVHTLVAVRFNHCAGSEATSGNNLTTICINGGICCRTGDKHPVTVLRIRATLCTGVNYSTGCLRPGFNQLISTFINNGAEYATAAVYPLRPAIEYRICRLTMYALAGAAVDSGVRGAAACQHALQTVSVNGRLVCHTSGLNKLATAVGIVIIAIFLTGVDDRVVCRTENQLGVMVADNSVARHVSGNDGTDIVRRIISQCRRACHQSGNCQRENSSAALSFCFCQF
ncbi:hypothetical protein BN128_1880 [Cronobacter sakazakii 696]|nr:hypothetical protein BN128_1880 [Cronobacter sakazakii 696]